MKLESPDWTDWANMPAVGDTVHVPPMLVTARGLGYVYVSPVGCDSEPAQRVCTLIPPDVLKEDPDA
jgi:hypothetical protein